MLSVGNYINARSIELESELRTDHGNGQKRWAIKNRPLICPFSYDTGFEKRFLKKDAPSYQTSKSEISYDGTSYKIILNSTHKT